MEADVQRNLDNVIETLRNNWEKRQRGCNLLIGAGCSVTAGIDTASGFVNLIEQRFSASYALAASSTSGRPNYSKCMAQLPPGERRDLICRQVDQARLNWAHISIAQLIKSNFVDRVLTTNFDPLVLRACALLGEFPAVYDFATSQVFRRAELPKKTIFHLHGQSTGFILMNTEDEVEKHAARLKPLFEHIGQDCPWIVIGYSGDNDPVFNHLASIEQFPFGLYRIGFKNNDPGQHIRDNLLIPGKNAYYISGYDADQFFTELARKLGCFPPDFVIRPFTFLKQMIIPVVEYSLPFGDNKLDILDYTKTLIDQAIKKIESTESLALTAIGLLMEGKYQELEYWKESLREMPPSVQDIVAWSLIQQGNVLSDQAQAPNCKDSGTLFLKAIEMYNQAFVFNANKYEALNNWAMTLVAQAKTKEGDESDKLFLDAGEKYRKALDLNPMFFEALHNWGIMLAEQAKITKNVATGQSNVLLEDACEKFEKALAIRSDSPYTLKDYANALARRGLTKSDDEAQKLLNLAYGKYDLAVKIKPDFDEVLYDWGTTLNRGGPVKIIDG